MYMRVFVCFSVMFLFSNILSQTSTAQTAVSDSTEKRQSDQAFELYAGDWSGELAQFGLTLVIHVGGDTAETATVSLDSPNQNAFGLPGEVKQLTTDSFIATFPSLNADLNLAHIGDQLVGTFKQGISLDITLNRVPEDSTETPAAAEPGPARPQSDALERAYNIEKVTFPGGADDVTLAGELTWPTSTRPKALLILISGSGPQDRNSELVDHKPFLVLSDHFTRAGYGVLRYDDRGIAESTGQFAKATTEDFAKDAAAALTYLNGRTDFKDIPIGYVGHSEGGLIAPLAAGLARPEMMVLLAGPAEPLSAVIIRQARDIAIAQGLPDAAVQAQDALLKAQFETLRTTLKENQKEALTDLFIREGLPENNAAVAAAQLTSPWMLWGYDYDPLPALAAYTGPILALYGALDLQVSANTNVPLVEEVIRHSASDVRILDGLNHLFQPTETGLVSEYSEIETTFDEGAMEDITIWLDQIAQGAGSPR